MIADQEQVNDTYIKPIKEETVSEPSYVGMSKEEKKKAKNEYKDEKKRIQKYNEKLKKDRETELPSLYEPLVLNLELLFALAEELDIDSHEKQSVDNILEVEGEGVFISELVKNKYSFSNPKEFFEIKLAKDEIIIPVSLLTTDSKIIVYIKESDNSKTIIDDLSVNKVERVGETFDQFYAYVTSETFKKYDWTTLSKIEIEVSDKNYKESIIFNFKVKEIKENFWIVPNEVEFEQL